MQVSKTSWRMAYHAACWSVRIGLTQILNVVAKNKTSGPQEIPYILGSDPHPFYGFRMLINQMRIRITRGLDSRSRAEFWKNDRAAVRAVRTIQ